jgi:peptidylprolyl isomerase
MILLLLSSQLVAAEPDHAALSEALGHIIGKNLEQLGVEIDLEALVRGMREEAEGKGGSGLSEEECFAAIATLHDRNQEEEGKKNLAAAEQFLEENREVPGVISLHDNRLQYRVERPGEGEVVRPYDTPLLRFSGRTLDGTPIGEIQEEQLVALEETIDGFAEGIAGMRAGEKRTLFIHPALGFSPQSGHPLPPSALLIFEVEVIQANGAVDPLPLEERPIHPPDTALQ